MGINIENIYGKIISVKKLDRNAIIARRVD